MNSKILLIGLIIAAIALSGCIQWPPICGNSFCESGEHWGEPNYCQADCPAPSGAVEVTVIDNVGPVGHADVQLRTAKVGNVVAETESNENGIALFNGIMPGTYFVDVEKTGYAKFKSDNYGVKEGVTVKIQAKLTPEIEFNTIAIGNNKIVYTDAQGIERSIPFYIKLANTQSQSTFVVSGQTFYYRCSSIDTYIKIKNYDRLNGWVIYLRDTLPATGSLILFTDIGDVDLTKLAKGTPIYLGGVQFDFQSFDRTTNSFTVLADGNCQFSKYSFSNPEYLEMGEMSPTNMRPLNNTVYYDDDNMTRGPTKRALLVTNETMQDTVNYVMYVERMTVSDGSIYLLLANSGFLTDENNVVGLSGTDIEENGFWESGWSSPDKFYYWPDTSDFGNNSGDDKYLVAHFGVVTDPLHDIYQQSRVNVFLDTATGNTLMFPNPQLSYYKGCVSYDNNTNYVKCDGVDMTATTAYGSKIKVDDGVAMIQIPALETSRGGGGPAA